MAENYSEVGRKMSWRQKCRQTKKMQTRPPDGIDFEWRTVETEVVDFQHSMVQVAQL